MEQLGLVHSTVVSVPKSSENPDARSSASS